MEILEALEGGQMLHEKKDILDYIKVNNFTIVQHN
jgi:hypothetical protein